MRATFNTLFGRLFGVLLVAIVLAHLLAFFWFHHYGPPPPPPQATRLVDTATRAHHRVSCVSREGEICMVRSGQIKDNPTG